jgi:hypothetical protein
MGRWADGQKGVPSFRPFRLFRLFRLPAGRPKDCARGRRRGQPPAGPRHTPHGPHGWATG